MKTNFPKLEMPDRLKALLGDEEDPFAAAMLAICDGYFEMANLLIEFTDMVKTNDKITADEWVQIVEPRMEKHFQGHIGRLMALIEAASRVH